MFIDSREPALRPQRQSPLSLSRSTAMAVIAAVATFAVNFPVHAASARKSASAAGSSVRVAAPASPIDQALTRAKSNLAKFPPDEFGAHPGEDSISDLVGRSFSIESKPTVRYDNGILSIYLNAGNTGIDSKIGLPETSKVVGTIVKANALGGKITVSKLMIDGPGLVFVNRPEDSGYLVRVQASGSEARALSQQARIRISGTIAERAGGKVAECSYLDLPDATADRPMEGRYRDCWVAVTLNSLAIVDGRSGRLLKQWSSGDLKADISQRPDPITLGSKPQ